jgi:hypothetical protein
MGPTQLIEVAPGVFRDIDTDTTVAFLEDGAGQVRGMVGPFPFIPFYKLRWFESAPFHFTLLAACVLLFVIALVSALRNRRADQSGPRPARWARRNLAALGLVHLAFLVAFGASIAAGMQDIIFALPKGLYVALALPLLALPLTLIAVVLAVRVWREGYWTRGARLWHSAGVAAAIAFVWFLSFWNLIGYKIG